jgi:thiamine biosynthesis protein ThiC
MIISRSKFDAEYRRGKNEWLAYRDNEIKEVININIGLHKEIGDLKIKVDKLSSQIREQSKADMIAKALEVIVKGSKISAPIGEMLPLYNSMLQSQQTTQAMAAQNGVRDHMFNGLLQNIF